MKSMYKIDRGGVKKSYIRKLPLVLYKIDRRGGGFQKLVYFDGPKACTLLLLLKLLLFFGRP